MPNTHNNSNNIEKNSKLEGTSSNLWSYVTVFGTLWGGLELTLGTFLHTLHIPKAGLIMVFLSVILLIAQRHIFPHRGSTLATGVIAGCIKCLSPGGIILGPLFGILTEAVFVELLLLLAPRMLLSNILTGGFAVLWSQVQGFVKQIIYYGGDIIEVYSKLALKFLGASLEGRFLLWSVAGIAAFCFIIGSISGVFGWILGKRINHRLSEQNALHSEVSDGAAESLDLDHEVDMHEKQEKLVSTELSTELFQSVPINRKKRKLDETIICNRMKVFPFALLTIVLQFSGNIYASIASIFVFFVILFVHSRNVLKALWWPKFWLLSLIVCGFSGAILAWNFEGSWNIQHGIVESVRMLLRGLYVFALLTWATHCMRPEEFISVWSKFKLKRMGIAITSSYELLPIWLEKMNTYISQKPRGILASFKFFSNSVVESLVEAVIQAESLSKTAWEKQ